MVAYSFKRQFVRPIRVGLGQTVEREDGEPRLPYPKRQTIRAERNGRSRHALPGEEMQLYFGMRTAACALIGVARCTERSPIKIDLKREHVEVDRDIVPFVTKSRNGLNEFARSDGFADWAEMRAFWRQTHPDLDVFKGVLLRWEPIA